MKDFVIASNFNEFVAECRRSSIDPHDYQYLYSPFQLEGVTEAVIHLIGGYIFNSIMRDARFTSEFRAKNIELVLGFDKHLTWYAEALYRSYNENTHNIVLEWVSGAIDNLPTSDENKRILRSTLSKKPQSKHFTKSEFSVCK